MINAELLKEIEEYCKLNDLDVRNVINVALIRGFDIEKFGFTPTSSKKLNKPVEVIKTVEKIVEKIVKVSDDAKVDELLKEIEKLKVSVDDYKGMFNSAKSALKECTDNNTKKDIYGE